VVLGRYSEAGQGSSRIKPTTSSAITQRCGMFFEEPIDSWGVRLEKVGDGERRVANHHGWKGLKRGDVEHAIVYMMQDSR